MNPDFPVLLVETTARRGLPWSASKRASSLSTSDPWSA